MGEGLDIVGMREDGPDDNLLQYKTVVSHQVQFIITHGIVFCGSFYRTFVISQLTITE